LATRSASGSGAALGLDYGTVRVGVAISDLLRITTRPLTVLNATNLIEELRAILEKHQVTTIVVGLPVSLAGIEGASAQGARAMAKAVEETFGLTTVFADERFTTTRAEEILESQIADRKERRKKVDATAAAVMLEGWLSAQRAVQGLPARYRVIDPQ
jgi:putative Holliday junction resolvase